MTILEERFYNVVPNLLRDIVDELEKLNETLSGSKESQPEEK